jgi:hypothetical protein
MTSWGRAENKAGRFLKQLEAQDLGDLTGSFSRSPTVNGVMREAAPSTGCRGEVMKDNFTALLVVALGVGVLIGYPIRRGTE